MTDTPVDLLAITAHPDDAELLCAGTLLRAASQGYRTAILDLTAGETGTYGDAGARGEEAATAARVLGLTARFNAGLPDAALENTPATRAILAGFLRRLRPRAVILHGPSTRHPDHRAAGQLAYDACFIAGLRRAGIEGEPHRPAKILFAMSYLEKPVKPSFVVDISDFMQRKLEAIFAYRSQFEGRTSAGDIFGGGRPLRDQILAHAAHYGSLVRAPYGEPFWTHETLRVDDVVALEVQSL